jgi:hypothetical protein
MNNDLFKKVIYDYENTYYSYDYRKKILPYTFLTHKTFISNFNQIIDKGVLPQSLTQK